MADARDPLCYRGIALASVSYKLHCNILNDRLTQWVDDNDLLADEQNGFRKERSTVDQLSSLTGWYLRSAAEQETKDKTATLPHTVPVYGIICLFKINEGTKSRLALPFPAACLHQ
jgi:hypothetical protein